MSGEQSKKNGKLGGRPPGRKNDVTLEREKVNLAVNQRILQKADEILNAQFSIAQGQQFLYRIDTEILSSGKRIKSKPVIVTDSEEIMHYLDGEYGEGESINTETEYYFITTKEPQNIAIDSMFNRALGKPTEKLEHSGDFTITVIKYAKGDNITPPLPTEKLPDSPVGGV